MTRLWTSRVIPAALLAVGLLGAGSAAKAQTPPRYSRVHGARLTLITGWTALLKR